MPFYRFRLDAPAEVSIVAERLRTAIGNRDANCTAERDLHEGDTAYYPAYLACLEAMTREPAKELRVTYAFKLK